jgi:hypothetical protein
MSDANVRAQARTLHAQARTLHAKARTLHAKAHTLQTDPLPKPEISVAPSNTCLNEGELRVGGLSPFSAAAADEKDGAREFVRIALGLRTDGCGLEQLLIHVFFKSSAVVLSCWKAIPVQRKRGRNYTSLKKLPERTGI